MKYFLTLLCLSSMLVISCGDDKPCQAVKAGGDLIGKEVPSMKREAFYKGKITTISPGAYRGQWVILFFYPADFTYVCPTELKELADYYGEFRSLNAEVLSVSTDSAFVHKAWHGSNELVKHVQYPMLSDRNGALSRQLGVYSEKTGTARRATFIINPEGKIVAYEIHSDDIGRSCDELLRKLNAAITVRGGAGGMCPAGWKPGDEVIKK